MYIPDRAGSSSTVVPLLEVAGLQFYSLDTLVRVGPVVSPCQTRPLQSTLDSCILRGKANDPLSANQKIFQVRCGENNRLEKASRISDQIDSSRTA